MRGRFRRETGAMNQVAEALLVSIRVVFRKSPLPSSPLGPRPASPVSNELGDFFLVTLEDTTARPGRTGKVTRAIPSSPWTGVLWLP